jgi:hypothetical protein
MEDTRKLSSIVLDEEPEATVEPEAESAEAAKPAPKIPEAQGDDVPDWVIMPKHLKVPRGKQIVFLRFPASLTDTPSKGDRQCIAWSLTDGEEKLAADRCDGKPNRAAAEYSKQMLRAVDGVVVDWSKPRGPGSVDEFWREIGPKGRNILMRVYTQMHLASDEELRDFFEQCVAVRTAG